MRATGRKITAAMGIMVVVLALCPWMARAGSELFAFHMAQHLLLIAVAAPLLAASGILGRLPVYPLAAWAAFVVTFLFWHWPAAFRWSAHRTSTELLEHLSILAGALLFWQAALSPRSLLGDGARAIYVMAAAAATDLPSVIMVFSPTALCAMPGENALRWGLDPIDDQRIAGMLMWVPANFVFLAIVIRLLARWLSETRAAADANTLC